MLTFFYLKFSDVKKIFVCFVLGISLCGCATYGDGIKKSLESIEQGNYEQAEKDLKCSLKPGGKDRLLYHMELGTIKRLDKNYLESNSSFEAAENISEELYTKKAKDALASLLLNPRSSSYPGEDFEKVYINYYKALNYFDLTCGGKGDIEDSIVELKRLDFKLKSFENEKGNYKEAEDSEKSKFAKLLNIFKQFLGESLDLNQLKYREDAYFRYFAGILYEFAGQYDSARIEYENAAKLYEKGYVKQYNLDMKMVERSWFDAIRMMKKSGGYGNKWSNLAKKKLSKKMCNKLRRLNKKESEIIVIDHIGKVPEKKEMNLYLKAESHIQSFSIRPIPVGTVEEINDQLAWFNLYYMDKNLVSLARAYSSSNLTELLGGIGVKTVFLGPLWEVAKKIGLTDAIGADGVRITIPYYPPIRNSYGESELIIGKKSKKLIRGESLGELALQSQLLDTGEDLRDELARASLKAVTTSTLTGGGFLGGMTCKIVTSATCAAETRNWLSLPLEIRINRISVPPGEHEVKVITKNKSGGILSTETRMIKVKSGESKLWIKRTF